MRINFVMSNKVYSGIFDAIINYFKTYLPENCELYVSEFPLNNMDIYHYHRPNLEDSLRNNSVVTVHHDLDDTDPWFDASQFIIKYHQADKIICLNNLQKDYLQKYENLENTSVIPHGVNKDIFYPYEKELPINRKVNIAIVSKRYARRVKGEALMYELYKRLDNSKISFYFLGENRNLDQYEAELFGFEAYSYEYLPYKLFNNFYKDIDILLIPSLFEGGPANLPEALFMRIPILARNIAMIKDYITDGKNGLILTGFPDEDAKMINNLVNNKDDMYIKLLNNIKNHNIEILDWKEVVLKHLDIYNEIINKELHV